MAPRPRLVLVTGGAGVIGSHVIQRLAADTKYAIRVLDTEHVSSPRVVWMRGSVLNKSACLAACNGADMVFHCAVWNDYWHVDSRPVDERRQLMVDGTQNMLDAAIECNVPTFVFASSSLVALNLDVDQNSVMEDPMLTVASKPVTPVAEAYRAAELMVLNTHRNLHRNGTTRLAAGVVRACGEVYGEGGSGLMYAYSRRLYQRVMDSAKLSQQTYAGNVAQGLVLLARRLQDDGWRSPVGGLEFFISDDDAGDHCTGWASPILRGAGLQDVVRVSNGAQNRVRSSMSMGLSGMLTSVGFKVASFPNNMVYRLHSRHHVFACAKAKAMLKYRPVVHRAEAIARTTRWLTAQREASNPLLSTPERSRRGSLGSGSDAGSQPNSRTGSTRRSRRRGKGKSRSRSRSRSGSMQDDDDVVTAPPSGTPVLGGDEAGGMPRSMELGNALRGPTESDIDALFSGRVPRPQSAT